MRKNVLLQLTLQFCLLSQVTAESDTPEMLKARGTGATVVRLMQDYLTSADKDDFPGVHAWMTKEGAALQALNPEQPDNSWRKLNSDKLVHRNANFWQLFYEVAPGDPGLGLLHAGCLMVAGDADRAQTILRLSLHRQGLGEDIPGMIIGIAQHCQLFVSSSNAMVTEGIALHDAKDFEAALAKYDAALRLWPLNGWASYERGTTLRLTLGGDSEVVVKAFAECRRSQPFQFPAWQGVVKEVPGMERMLIELPDLWKPSLKDIKFVMPTDDLRKMSEILQEAEVDDLALVTRQIYIARRGRYLAADHPFIARSLRRLVPGKQAETTLAKLAGANFMATQIIAIPADGAVNER